MLTDISSHNFQNHHVKVVDRTSLASPLTKVGFDIYWYSLQYRISMENYGKKFSGTKHYIGHDEIISRQASIGEDNYNDQIVIPILEKNVKQDTVYMIHLRGSHAKYSQKYGREHAKFQPDLGDDDISTSNAYNNTIVYLDEMVNKLVEKFKDRNAFIFYVSDHGESLGVDGNGFRAHGCCAKVEDAPTQQKHVPMILWMSDKFASHNPEKFNNVKKLFQNREKLHLTHDNVFHSFLDCLNVKSEIINKELSLCSGLKKTTK
jgi:glucan phosphoethanolaminetransferase (alkaline phosphatase superfamily)